MIRIITDSASDLTKEEILEDNIDVIPLHITIGGKEYLDRVDITSEEFFKKLIENTELPKTSQATPISFINEFEKFPDDEIICITMSKKLSGTYQSACVAASDFDNVCVIDSENVTVGQKILVKLAARLIKEGKSFKEIVDTLNQKKENIKLIALLDTLEYLKKGGRISAVTAVIGTFLNVKPVVEIKKGEVKILGKARGSKMGNNKLREKIEEYGGIDFEMPFSLAYSGLDNSLLMKYIEDSKDVYPENTSFDITLIGSTIGTHVGPGAIAVAFFSK